MLPWCGRRPVRATPNPVPTNAFAPCGRLVAADCEVLHDGQPPTWTVRGVAATRPRRSSKIGLTALGLDESGEILRAGHRDGLLRTRSTVAAVRWAVGGGR